jgi:hypothetical protein
LEETYRYIDRVQSTEKFYSFLLYSGQSDEVIHANERAIVGIENEPGNKLYTS